MIKKFAYGLVFGFLLSGVGGINFMMWEFYAIAVPVVALVEWKAS